METLMQMFAPLLVFVYHCFDRIVVNGYLAMLSQPNNVVYFFHQVLRMPCITKEALSKRTDEYHSWVESYAKNRAIPIQWAEKGLLKEDYVRKRLKEMEKQNKFCVYFIFKSMEQGSTFRSIKSKYPTNDPNYRIIKRTRSRFTHYYFYMRYDRAGPMAIRVAFYLPFQVTCYLNGHNIIEGELRRAGLSYRKTTTHSFLSAIRPLYRMPPSGPALKSLPRASTTGHGL